MRTFVALEIPRELKLQLRREQRRLQGILADPGAPDVVRWTNTDNLHVTLRFLGETDDGQRRAIQSGLAALAAAREPLRLTFTRLGSFSSRQRPRVVWLGVGGDTTSLRRIQKEVERLARQAGFVPEERVFRPHVTMARSRRGAPRAALRAASDRLLRAAREGPPRAWATWQVGHLCFVRSVLGSGRADYSTLVKCPLGARK